MRYAIYVCAVFALSMMSACNAEPAPDSTTDAVPAASTTASDPLTGTWKGDWGTAADQRTPLTVELSWDGKNLSGSVNPGPDAVSVTKGAFMPETGTFSMEASANGPNGKMVHYTAEGKLTEGALSGTWTDDSKKGDFKLTKS